MASESIGRRRVAHLSLRRASGRQRASPSRARASSTNNTGSASLAAGQAAATLEQLLRLLPHDAWVYRQLGFLKLRQGDNASAQKAFAETLQRLPTDGSAAQHLFDLAGSLEASRQRQQHVVLRENVEYDRQLFALAKGLVEFQQAPVADRRRHFKVVRRHLAAHFDGQSLLRATKDVRRTFRRAGKVFVREGAGSAGQVWFVWKLNWQWLLAAVVVSLLLLR